MKMNEMKKSVKDAAAKVDASRLGHAVVIGGAAALGTASVVASGALVYHVAKFAVKHWLLTSAVACVGVGIAGGTIAYRDGDTVQSLVNPE